MKKGSWEIQGTTFLRVGIASILVAIGLDQLLFSETWVQQLPEGLSVISVLNPTTIVHIGAAVQLVFGLSLILGLFTRLSAVVLMAFEVFTMFAAGHGHLVPENMIWGVAALAIFLDGADHASLDYHYLLGPHEGSVAADVEKLSLNSPPPALSYINQILFGVIGVLIVTAGGIALSYARDTFKLDVPQVVAQTTTKISAAPKTVPASAPAPATSAVAPVAPAPAPKKVPPPPPAGYTAAQVAAHNSGASCYTIVDGSVYNLTSWVNLHPGGSAVILGMCGIDSTAAFTAKHGGQRQPQEELAIYRIGPLIQ